MIENAVGVFGMPFGVAPNFVVNGRECLVPLVVEEPSIVAGLSSAAAMARSQGGFKVESDGSLLIGQVHITDVSDPDHAIAALEKAKPALLDAANAVHPRLSNRGGGVRDLELRLFELLDGRPLIAVHVLVDTCDAMGANLVNSICEAIGSDVAAACEGQVALRILSNLADRSLYTARVRYKLPDDVRDAIVTANNIALVDPYRAATHNKGIMNGIDAVAIATGNDWRAIEAGAHAFAAMAGSYQPLSTWTSDDDGALHGTIRIPLKVGIVGLGWVAGAHIETFKAGMDDKVYGPFNRKGCMLPDGVCYLDSWLSNDRTKCFQLMETDRFERIEEWIAKWDDLIEFEIVSVQDSPTKAVPKEGIGDLLHI